MYCSMVAVAQLVRAPDCGSGGRGFETHQPPITKIDLVFYIGSEYDRILYIPQKDLALHIQPIVFLRG